MLSRVNKDELMGGSGAGAERTVLFEGKDNGSEASFLVNIRPDRLQMVCIHASPALIQEDRESEPERVTFNARLREHASGRIVEE